jgi:hypothetical protein
MTHLGSGVCIAAVKTMLTFAEGLGAIPGYRDLTPPVQAPLNVGTGVVAFCCPWCAPERRGRAS